MKILLDLIGYLFVSFSLFKEDLERLSDGLLSESETSRLQFMDQEFLSIKKEIQYLHMAGILARIELGRLSKTTVAEEIKKTQLGLESLFHRMIKAFYYVMERENDSRKMKDSTVPLFHQRQKEIEQLLSLLESQKEHLFQTKELLVEKKRNLLRYYGYSDWTLGDAKLQEMIKEMITTLQ